MYHKLLKYLSVTASIVGLLSVNIAFADLQQLVPLSSSVAPTVSPVTKSWPIGCYDFTGNLWSGMKGITVRHLQYFLMKEGFDIPQQEFGVYGSITGNAVIAFKQKYASEILAPAKLTHGNGNVDRRTRLKLNSLYSCNVVPVTQVIDSYTLNVAHTPAPAVVPQANLAVTNTTLDSNGVGVTFCNKGASDLLTAPFRVRLNGINRDFEVTGAQKAGACETDVINYGTWGLTYDPGTTYTVVSIIDPNGYYKTSGVQYPIGNSNTLTVPAVPGAHLSVRSVLIKTSGIQTTLCNLGTIDLNSFPVRITVNGTVKDFEVPQSYKKGVCSAISWTYDNWGLNYTPKTVYTVSVQVDPNNTIIETNKFDNTATAVGTP